MTQLYTCFHATPKKFFFSYTGKSQIHLDWKVAQNHVQLGFEYQVSSDEDSTKKWQIKLEEVS